MPLIKSISGIRGTIGGDTNSNLTPINIVQFISAYGSWIKLNNQSKKYNIVVGRDARISGKIISNLVISTLQSLGIDVIYLELTTTPTLGIIITDILADGGIMITASHNSKEWNALKLLNKMGELISNNDGEEILNNIQFNSISFELINKLGKVTKNLNAIDNHINKILKLPLVNKSLIKEKKFKVIVDCINSSGSISIIPLLKKIGCEVIELNSIPNGFFAHDPEPLIENLHEIMDMVPKEKADLGIVVDPDVDRLVFINEDGTFFGEEYTLIVIADYILQKKKGATVSNLSSSSILKKITHGYHQKYFSSEVGEFYVVQKMKKVNAIIGGEGNGGIIYPELHYGRDALVGVALFLSYLAESNKSCKELRNSYLSLFMSKRKIRFKSDFNIDYLFNELKKKYNSKKIISIDGLKIFFYKKWIHLRKSNTEPIIRIYTEAYTEKEANNLSKKIIKDILLINKLKN